MLDFTNYKRKIRGEILWSFQKKLVQGSMGKVWSYCFAASYSCSYKHSFSSLYEKSGRGFKGIEH